jgi:glucose-6-phosphate 1-dehydrogenase
MVTPSVPLDRGRHPAVESCTLVIFGASGDLARRKLIPALYNLLLDHLLPDNFSVVGTSRKEMSHDEFRARMRHGVEKYSRRPVDPMTWSKFERRLFYLNGSITDAQTYAGLKSTVEKIEADLRLPGHRIFYLAVPPDAFAPICEGLQHAGLTYPPDPSHPFCRIIVEKPIGHDLESARHINRALAQVFDESQIFRIDHYLGKETVQNIMVLRFANSIFEPIWNRKYIDHVQITVCEAEGVGSRAAYYEQIGALRDMVQNHILQLLCLVAMEPPHSLDANVVRDARIDVLRGLRPIVGKEVDRMTVRAQYGRGRLHGADMSGYREEPGVQSNSTTETYVALKLCVENWRWAGVPFYLRTGKALPKRASEVAVQFKDIPQILFNANPNTPQAPNVLALRIQPEEGFSLRVISKVPGSKARTHPVEMNFDYEDAFTTGTPEAYERLLLDVMVGDASLFMRRDAVEASWAWVSQILDGWKTQGKTRLPEYPAGAWGPAEADDFIQADGRAWRTM